MLVDYSRDLATVGTLHARSLRSLQGFGYGDVVHQFENRYKILVFKLTGLRQRHLCKCKYRIRIIKNTPHIEAIGKS